MGVLKNAKHERFAQEVAKGKAASEAYVIAGYAYNEGNAVRLKGNEKVQARIEEILSEAAERAGITIERVATELAKIGFSDIRKAVDWSGELVEEADNPDGGDVLVIKHIHSSHVRLISAKDIDDDTAAAIAEVRQSPTGGLSIKMHDKRAALVDLGKYLGMFRERVEHSGPEGGPIQTQSNLDLSKLDDSQLKSLAGIIAAAGGNREGN